MADFLDIRSDLMINRTTIVSVTKVTGSVHPYVKIDTDVTVAGSSLPLSYNVHPEPDQTIDELYQHIRALLGTRKNGYRHSPPALKTNGYDDR